MLNARLSEKLWFGDAGHVKISVCKMALGLFSDFALLDCQACGIS